MKKSKLFGNDEHISQVRSFRARDPLTAAALSVVPGLGQFYTGQTTKGFLFFDVALVNLVLLSMMAFAGPIAGFLETASKEAHGQVNKDVLNAFTQLQIGHPASTALLLLIAAFALYAARDAYDAAIDQKRRAIYWDSVIEIAEAASGSYLMHFAGIITCAILAIFLLAPPQPKPQVTEITFFTDPLKPTKPPVKADLAAQTAHSSTLKRISDHPLSIRQSQSQPSRPTVHHETQTAPASHTNQTPAHLTPAPAPPHPMPTVRPLLAMAPAPTVPALPHAAPMHTPTPVPTPVNAVKPAGVPAPMPMPNHAPAAGLPLLPTATAIASSGVPSAPHLPHALNSAGSPASAAAPPGPIAMPSTAEHGVAPAPASAPSGGQGPSHAVSTGDIPGPSRDLRPTGSSGSNLAMAHPALGSHPGSRTDSSEDNGKDNDGKDGPKTRDFDVDFTRYMADLQRRIKSHWSPIRFPTSNRVMVTFKLSAGGELFDLHLDRSSGDGIVDRAAMQAIRESAPFPHLPAGAEHSPAAEDGKVTIQFTFDYNVFGGKGRMLGF